MRERKYEPPTPVTASKGLVRLSPLVPPDVHATAFENAKAMGVSMGKYITELIRRDQVDANGVPLWAHEAREPNPAQAELPVNEAETS
ncbi:hypothetical protein KN815_16195 [Streptomyces sp. 4503]|uniref:Toxin-antitoxin system HicB family antitoxin n=1 Tax=Streptomyces niphimycinicus TaxID=2842201 RepID=A0ABS6CF58_9ACTN|nr:hypothetical protein [Streptomyces niphimycinicus]MBU3865563.1 hypothetical protein [Streptomyces niphimycinicus]